MKIKNLFFAAIGFGMLLSSCSTPKNITYFQDLTNGETILLQQVRDIRVKPEDKLSIIVSTQDNALSGLFNLGQSSMAKESASVYTVGPDGDINFPVLGKLEVAGMNRGEIAQYIEEKLIAEDLVKQPVVTVEFVNTGVIILGSVSSPGRYDYNQDRITILDAIASAGDLTINGCRENVLVLRTENGKQHSYFVDLTNARTLAQSPVYYLQQDDIIYVEPDDKTKRETTSTGNTPFTPSFWVSIISSAVSITTLVITLTKL